MLVGVFSVWDKVDDLTFDKSAFVLVLHRITDFRLCSSQFKKKMQLQLD